MKRSGKRIIAALLAVLMIVSVLPAVSLQADAAEILETRTGLAGIQGQTNVTWTLDIYNAKLSNGKRPAKLTLSGSGPIQYVFWNLAEQYNVEIGSVTFGNGITSICDNAFWGLDSAGSIELPNSVVSIGAGAFAEFCDADLMGNYYSVYIPSSVKSIGEGAFAENVRLSEVLIASPVVAKALTDKYSCGELVRNATTIMIATSITEVGSYVTDNYETWTTETFNGIRYNVYKPTHEHRYYVDYGYDEDIHYQVCAVCDYENKENHNFVGIRDNCQCFECGYKKGHEYSAVILPGETDKSVHGYVCIDCGIMKDTAPHDYENSCDTVCDTCGYEREITHSYQKVWTTTETEHWYECSVCGDKKNHAEHIWDNVCDTVCGICGYMREVPHSYDQWSKNESGHWHECRICAKKVDTASHDYSDDYETCSVCGYNIEEGSFYAGTGTQDNPYIIKDLSHFLYLARTVEKGIHYQGQYVKLANNLKLNDETFTYLPDSGLVKVTDGNNTAYLGTGIPGAAGGYSTVFDTTASVAGTWYLSDRTGETGEYAGALNSWVPIGHGRDFSGTFLGNGYTISGLYLNNAEDYNGLFGSANGTISNIYLKNSYIRGGSHTGGIAGDGGTLDSCYSNAIVCGESNVGGITGDGSMLTACTNEGVIAGTGSSVGGVAGYAGEVKSGHNMGTVYGYQSVAGIAGYSSNGVTDSCNTGTVTGTSYNTAGIVGMTNGWTTIENCTNTGNIKGVRYVGGIIADGGSGVEVSNCYNTGTITGTDNVAGIVAYVWNGYCRVTTCYNGGTVSGEGYVGGVVGQAYCTSGNSYIQQSYNMGNITATDTSAGGIAADLYDCPVTDCYNQGTVTGGESAAGIVGQMGYGVYITTCYSTGYIYTTKNHYTAGGICGSCLETYVTNCYYLENSVICCYKLSTQKYGYGIGSTYEDKEDRTEAKSLTALKNYNTFTGFDFTNVWQSGGLPYLKAIYHYDHRVASSEWKSNGVQHWQACKCGMRFYPADHVYSNICDTTCNTCGYTREIVHSFSEEWIAQDETNHAQVCSVCRALNDCVPHVYTDACDMDCSICDYVRTAPHIFATEYTFDETVHWLACTACDAVTSLSAHDFDHSCDTTCNTCTYEREITHQYSESWTYDNENHWRVCGVCKATTTQVTHKFDNDCDTTCNICTYTRTTTHVYDNSCDTDCNVCGVVREITHKYGTNYQFDDGEHWYECTVCGDKKDSASHAYDDVCDTTCNICDYTHTDSHKYSAVFTWNEDHTSCSALITCTKCQDTVTLDCTVTTDSTDTAQIVHTATVEFFNTTFTDVKNCANNEVVFKDWDGKTISQTHYHLGDTVVIPADPTRAADNTYTYVFAGWDSAVSETCTGPAVYTATYKETYIVYTVVFTDENGTVLSSKTYHYGDTVTAPEPPVKEATEEYTYVFSGWNPTFSEQCTGNVTYAPTYTAERLDDWTYTISSERVTITGYTGNAAHLVVPTTIDGYPVKSIASGALKECTSIVSLVIPDSVTSIGEGALAGCINLETLTIPFIGASEQFAEATSYYDRAPFGYIFGRTAYTGAVATEQAMRSKSTNSVPSTSRKTYYIPDKLTSVTVMKGNIVPWGAFENCGNLVSVTLPEELTIIDREAFLNCTGLQSVDLGENVTEIGQGAFQYCTSLQSVTIPDSTTVIRDYAFDGCTSMETVTIGKGVTSIGYVAFENCDSLTEIVIPDNVTSLYRGSFYSCDNLATVIIGTGITEIPEMTFYNCRALKTLQIGENVTTIGESAFYYCNSLEMLVLPEKVGNIEDNAFYYCTALKVVVMGSNVRARGYIFYKCNELEHIAYGGTQSQWNTNMDYYVSTDGITVHYEAPADAVVLRETALGTECYCTICEKALFSQVLVDSIEIQKLPDKVEYFGKKDTLDVTGGEILVRQTTGKESTIAMTQEMVTGFDNSKTGEVTLTVTVEGKTATFTVKIVGAAVTFLNADGSVISTAEYLYGDTVVIPADPEKPDSIQEDFVFLGWDKEVTVCEGETVYTAVFGSGVVRGNLVGEDDTVNEEDALYLLKHILLPEFYAVNQSVDYNGDGNVNEDDVLRLLKFILMPGLFPLL